MGFFWRSPKPVRGLAGPPRRRRHVELTLLEGRQMPTVSSVTAVIAPRILPNTAGGRFVPVTVSGTITQVFYTELGDLKDPPPAEKLAAIDASHAKKPPPVAIGNVTDQFRVVEPRVRMPVSAATSSVAFFTPGTASNSTAYEWLVRTYDYSFTVYLKAQTSSINRQYTITAAANDGESAAQITSAVVVPTQSALPRGRPGARKG